MYARVRTGVSAIARASRVGLAGFFLLKDERTGDISRRMWLSLRLAAVGLALYAVSASCATAEELDDAVLGARPGGGSGTSTTTNPTTSSGPTGTTTGDSTSTGTTGTGGTGSGTTSTTGTGGPSSATTGSGGSSSTTGSGGGGSSATSGTAGSGTTGGSGGTGGSGVGGSGASGCSGTPDWMSGGSYKSGDAVRGVCENPGGGAVTCSVGKTYVWTCINPSFCSNLGPGANGWWGVWTIGMQCN